MPFLDETGVQNMTADIKALADIRYLKVSDPSIHNLTESLTINATNLDVSTASTNTWGDARLEFYDSNSVLMGYIDAFKLASLTPPAQGVQFVSTRDINNTTIYNGFYLGIKDDGSPYISFSSNDVRDAWAKSLNVVKKAGDTMTGDLTIEKNSQGFLTFKNTSVSMRVSAPAIQETQSLGGLHWRDSNDELNGYIEIKRAYNTNNVYLQLNLRRYNSSGQQYKNHGFSMQIDDNLGLSVTFVSTESRDAWVDGLNVVNRAGDVMTGSLTTRYSQFDLSKTDNGTSSAIYPTTFNIQDKDGRIAARLESVINSNGNVGSYWYIRNYNTSGTQVAQKGIQLTMNKSGTLTYSVADAENFRSAIGTVNKAGDTMTGNLTISGSSGDAGLFTQRTDITNGKALFGYGSSNNHGIYSYQAGKWVFQVASDNKVYVNGLNLTDAASARSSIGAVSKAGDTLSGNFATTASDASGRYFKVKNSKHEGSLYVDGNGNLGLYSDTKGKWVIKCDTSGNVLVNNGWTQIAQVQGTNSATYNATGYLEFLLMIWSGTGYMGTAVIPPGALGATQYEIYVGGWGNNTSSSNRMGVAKVSNAKLTGVAVRTNNTDVTSSSYFRLYAR